MAAKKDYLHPNWQKKRLEILSRDKFTCTECGTKEETLHVHHSHYNNYSEYWGYSDSSYLTLCEECHKRKHDYIKELDPMKIRRLSDLLEEFHAFSCDNYRYMDDYQNYKDLVLEYISSGEGYIYYTLDEDEPPTEDYLNNFNMIESLLSYKVRYRNVKTFIKGYVMFGENVKPKDIGKELLDVSRDLKRSVFNG